MNSRKRREKPAPYNAILKVEDLQKEVRQKIRKFHSPFYKFFTHFFIGNFFFLEAVFINYLRDYLSEIALNKSLLDFPDLKNFKIKVRELIALGVNLETKKPIFIKDPILLRKYKDLLQLQSDIPSSRWDECQKHAQEIFHKLADQTHENSCYYKFRASIFFDILFRLFPDVYKIIHPELGMLCLLPTYKKFDSKDEKNSAQMSIATALASYERMDNITEAENTERSELLLTLNRTLDQTHQSLRSFIRPLVFLVLLFFVYTNYLTNIKEENNRSSLFTLLSSFLYSFALSGSFTAVSHLYSDGKNAWDKKRLMNKVDSVLPYLNHIAKTFGQNPWIKPENILANPFLEINLIPTNLTIGKCHISKKLLSQALAYAFSENGIKVNYHDEESVVLDAHINVQFTKELVTKLILDVNSYLELNLPREKKPSVSPGFIDYAESNIKATSGLKKGKKILPAVSDIKTETKLQTHDEKGLSPYKVTTSEVNKLIERNLGYSGKVYELTSPTLWPAHSHFGIFTAAKNEEYFKTKQKNPHAKKFAPEELKRCHDLLKKGVYGQDFVKCKAGEQVKRGEHWIPGLYKLYLKGTNGLGDLRVFCYNDTTFKTTTNETIHVLNFSERLGH